jgi:hypothetical protein
MYRPTISIRAMLCVVAFIAVACVTLARANAMWASLTFTAALAAISFGLLAAIVRRGAKQAFWMGFALFGWLYIWLAHWPSDFSDFGAAATGPTPWRLQNDSSDTLATTQLLVYAYMEWLPRVREMPAPPVPPAPIPGAFGGGLPNTGFGGFAGGGFPPAPPTYDYPALHEFTRVGHSLFTVLLALVGGILAANLYRTRDQTSSDKRAAIESLSG